MGFSVVSASFAVNMLVTLLLASLVAGLSQGSHLGYAVYNVDGSLYHPAYYPAAGRTSYSYAPVTHAYGNVNHPAATPYLYTRLPADIPYGEQDRREGYSYSAPVVYPSPAVLYPARHPYSYPPVTHAYGNVNHPVATPYLYTRLPADIPYGEQDREGYSYTRVVPGYALGEGTAFMFRRVDSDY